MLEASNDRFSPQENYLMAMAAVEQQSGKPISVVPNHITHTWDVTHK
jgi:hypothetical protein